MKKAISLLMIVAIIASIAAVNVNATILFQDTFDTELQENWLYDSSKFYLEEGWLVGDHTAVVHQSRYADEEWEYPNPKEWTGGDFTVDIKISDYSADSDDYGAGLWWRDYQLSPNEEYYEGMQYDNGVIYTLSIQTESNRVILEGDFSSMELTTEEYTGTDTTAEVVSEEDENVLMEYVLPEGYLEVNFADPTIVTLGMKVEPTGISAFLDGNYLFTYNSPTLLGSTRPSPVLLVNYGLIVGFDNFTVASLDHGLLTIPQDAVTTAAVTGGEQGGNVTPTPQPPETKVEIVTETQIVTDTDEAGNIVEKVEVVTKEVVVTVPAADTNTGGTAGGNATTTGDMAVIVIAAMIVSLGAAIVVKKVSAK